MNQKLKKNFKLLNKKWHDMTMYFFILYFIMFQMKLLIGQKKWKNVKNYNNDFLSDC